MKKLYNLISVMIIFGVVLFANISFAKTDEELAFEVATAVLNNSQFGSRTMTLESTTTEIPIVVTSDKLINQAVSGFSSEGKAISAEFNNSGVIEVTIDGKKYEYAMAIGTGNGSARVSDQTVYDITYVDLNIGGTENWVASKGFEDRAKEIYKESNIVLEEGEEVYFASFVGGKQSIELDGGMVSFNYDVKGTYIYLTSPSNIDEDAEIKDPSQQMRVGEVRNGSVNVEVSGNQNPGENITPGDEGAENGDTATHVHVDLPNRGDATEGVPIENLDTTSKKEKYFSFDVSSDGAYIILLQDESGRLLEASEYKIYSEDRTEVFLQTNTNEAKTASLRAGKYYVYVPNGGNYTVQIVNAGGYNDNLEELVGVSEQFYDESGIGDSPEDDAELYEIVISWFILTVGRLLNGLISIVAGDDISIGTLVFDQYSRTTLTFFKNDIGYYPKENELLAGSQGPLNSIFNLFRDIAVICYMVILIYMGIRVLFLATADKKAKYKEILFDWVKGVAIIYFFPYIMRYAILLNHGFVTYLSDNTTEIFAGNEAVISSSIGGLSQADNVAVSNGSDYMSVMYKMANKTRKLSYSICWFVMLIQVIQFLIVYLKRLITIMFLIAIFPLVAISYAIDKIGDGKSQAFSHWCKEFVLQVFIQSFHAINYVLIMGIIFNIPQTKSDTFLSSVGVGNVFTTNWFLVIIGITYIAKGGDILRGLFAQMGGGAGKDGGLLTVASSVVKTKIAIGAVKSIGKVASNTFGSNSLIGKGAGYVGNAYDAMLERNYIRAERKTYEKLQKEGRLITITPTGSRKIILTDEQIKKHLEELKNSGTLSDEEFTKRVDALRDTSGANLKRAVGELGMSEAEVGELDSLLGYSMALDVVGNKSRRRKLTDVQIQQSVEIVLRDRTTHTSSSGGRSTKLDRYIEATKDRVSNKQVREVSASHSVRVNNSSSRVHEAPPADKKEAVARAFTAVRTARDGEYGAKELHHHLDVIKSALEDDDVKDYAENERDSLTFDLDAFETNLHVQTINASSDPSVYADMEYRELLDESIRYVKKATEDGIDKEVLKGLNTKVDKLKEGVLPEIINKEKDEKSKLEKEVSEMISKVDNPYRIDRGERYQDYLKMKERDLSRRATGDLAKGIGTMATGVGTAGLKTGAGIATAGIFAGSSMAGKDNSINELLTVVPSAFAMVDDVSGKIGKAGSAVTRPVVDAIEEMSEKPKVSLKTELESVELSRKYYDTVAKERAVKRELSEAEAERRDLLEKLNKKISKETKK